MVGILHDTLSLVSFLSLYFVLPLIKEQMQEIPVVVLYKKVSEQSEQSICAHDICK